MISVTVNVTDRKGALNEILKVYHENELNLTHISSKPLKFVSGSARKYLFEIHTDTGWDDVRVQNVYGKLKKNGHGVDINMTP